MTAWLAGPNPGHSPVTGIVNIDLAEPIPHKIVNHRQVVPSRVWLCFESAPRFAADYRIPRSARKALRAVASESSVGPPMTTKRRQ